MATKETNPFKTDWEKRIESLDFEDLARILANKQDYAPEFVEMVQQKLMSHSRYSEEYVNEIIAQENEERQKKEKQAEQKMSGWLILFMFGIVVGCLSYSFNILSYLSLQNYGDNAPLMWADITFLIGIIVLSAYTFISLYKRWANAIHLTRFYIWIGMLLCAIPFLQMFNEVNSYGLPYLQVTWGIIVSILWLMYFKYSKRIQARYPSEERHLFKRDPYILGSIIVIPLLLLLWGLL